MKTIRQLNHIKQQIIRLGAVSDSSHSYRTSLLSILRDTVPFDLCLLYPC